MQVVLSPTPEWTPPRLSRLFCHLLPGVTQPLELCWVHGADLSRDFYQSALTILTRALPSSPIEIRHTLRIPLSDEPSETRLARLLRLAAEGPGGGPVPLYGLEFHVHVREVVAEGPRTLPVDSRLPPVAMVAHLAPADLDRLDAFYDHMVTSELRSWRLELGGLTAEAARTAVTRLARRHLKGDRSLRLEPIDLYHTVVRNHHALSAPADFYDRRAGERQYVIDGEGRVGGVGDLFETPLAEIVAGSAYQAQLLEAEHRTRQVCSGCELFGSCSGQAASEPRHAVAADDAPCAVIQPVLQGLSAELRPVAPERTPAAPHGELRPGVGIRSFVDDDELAARVTLSAGTTSPPASGERYHVAALVPAEPWRAPSPADLAVLSRRPDVEWNIDSDIAIVRPSASLLEPLLSASQSGAPADLDAPAWQTALARVKPELAAYQLDSRGIDVSVLYRSRAGVPTVTRVRRGQHLQDVLLGLHVDSWEGTSLRRRQGIRNRFCINLSDGPRYLLFVNLTLAQMMADLGLAEHEDVNPVTLFSGHRFLRRFPRYPVVRLELRPLEAYIAPTGHVLHDGAAPQCTESDLALHLLGYFGPPPGASIHGGRSTDGGRSTLLDATSGGAR